ncbi:MAG TPA: hypothetical protein PK826_14315, partial [Anaerolineae bacterium]|nr:hypothetical protein [Anaerolineae bacterium]
MSLLERLKGAFLDPSEEASSKDVGRTVIDAVYRTMQIDAPWSLRAEREFSWWGYRLKQRVWAGAPHRSGDEVVTRVWARTDVLRGVPDRPKTYAAIAEANILSAMSALVYDPDTRRVVLNCSMIAHQHNQAWLEHYFGMAVALQVCQAESLADELARKIGGEPDVSAHADSGPRSEPDDMLNMMSVEATSPKHPQTWLTRADFQAITDRKSGPWVLATADVSGMTAEMPFINDVPAAAALVSGDEATPPGTALLMANVDQPHPILGDGLLVRVGLPIQVDAEFANTLNLLETTGPWETHQLGAWCDEGWHVAFVPGTLFEAAGHEARRGYLLNAVMAQVIRVRGMLVHLREHEQPQAMAGPPVGRVTERAGNTKGDAGAADPAKRGDTKKAPPRLAKTVAVADAQPGAEAVPPSPTSRKDDMAAFAWSNITKGISKELAREAGLRVSKSEEDLRDRYGEPPGEELVTELWPILLDKWLGTQPRWRDLVVEQLRAAKLGDTSIRLSTKSGQMSYLRSCRQSPRLRATVLQAFIAAGKQPMMSPSVYPDGTPVDRSDRPASTDRKQRQAAGHEPVGGELGARVAEALE